MGLTGRSDRGLAHTLVQELFKVLGGIQFLDMNYEHRVTIVAASPGLFSQPTVLDLK